MEHGDKPTTVSVFEYESSMWHFNMVNKRMLIALITVCVTFIITILVFVHGYTVREKNWLDTLSNLNPQITEVKGCGICEQPSP